MELEAGQRLEVTCEIENMTTSGVLWYQWSEEKGYTQISSGLELVKDQLSAEDGGVYRCELERENSNLTDVENNTFTINLVVILAEMTTQLHGENSECMYFHSQANSNYYGRQGGL